MKNIKILAVGDISLQTRTKADPFGRVLHVFKEKDVLFGNLETVLSDNGKMEEKAVVLNTSPDNVRWLKNAGFDILNIANNHIMDLGPDSFTETLKVLNSNKLNFIGGSIDEFSESFVVIEVDNTKIGFLGYYEWGTSLSKNGAIINGLKIENINKDIEKLKTKCDIIIISLHWGIENVFYPSPKQIEIAHKLIDNGATIILGHHPHVIQGIEPYNDGLIAYSLGNFQFDPAISNSPNNQSFILSIEIYDKKLYSYDIIPILIDNNFIPTIANEKNLEKISSFIYNISQPVIRGEINDNRFYQEIAQPYLSGNMKSWIVRIRKYGIKHLIQCLLWSISPFCIKCYFGLIRKKCKAIRGCIL